MKSEYRNFTETLNKRGKPRIQTDFRLSRICTMGTGGECDLLITPDSIDCLIDTVRELRRHGIRYKVVGAASNLIFSDRGFRGAVIRTTALNGIKLTESGSIECEAGVFLPVLSRFTASNGFGGFHGLCGIPGTVGGSVITAAGAFGCNISDYVSSCLVYRAETDEVEELKLSADNFGYRYSPLRSENCVVLRVSFTPPQEDNAVILRKMRDCAEKRAATQPKGERSVGSFFKRPEGAPPAAFLIDRAGMKGASVGGARVSEIHAGFIINAGNATTEDVLSLANAVKLGVFEKFGVMLTEEAELVREK
ncbi:MAG: UDP-N-acetylmuramate dehydrogenase [Clostridia bacterium]|nr:UDP-N-acetylmuramate dehydrogenase [Clostridia bacterium]